MNYEIPSVTVFLSTYNGGRYLTEQIDSILSQKDVILSLYIRDDGSTDNTIQILEKYKNKINIYRGNNIGVGNSFMQLLYYANANTMFYAFCDQDDIWLPNKLSNAIETLKTITRPTLYCSNQILIDSKSNKIGKRYSSPPNTTYMQILNKNMVSGCTMVWNKSLHLLLNNPERRPSSNLLQKRIHDVWVAMVASVVGKIIYDNNAFILYRQHENNVVGIKKEKLLKTWKKKLFNSNLRNGRSDICREILQNYGDLITDTEISNKITKYAYYRTNHDYKKDILKDKTICNYTNELFMSLKMKILFNLF